MAVETLDWRAARAFVDEAKVRECCTAPTDAPEWMWQADAVPYLCLGLPEKPPAQRDTPFHVFASGWTQLEGVMIQMPEPDFAAGVRAAVVARSERALRDLLLTFPPGVTGLFYYSAPWALDVLSELFEGQSLPAREGYFATAQTFTPARTWPVRRLGDGDYEVLHAHWSPEVWEEVMADGYTVFAAPRGTGMGVAAFCFHWAIDSDRREVHGLQGVRDWNAGYAESVFSAATEDVLARGQVATCTACLAGLPWAEVPLRVGYRRFYTVRQFVGVKRGSGTFERTTAEAFFYGPRPAQAPRRTVSSSPSREVDMATVRALGEAKGRRRLGLFVAEGLTLAQRALQDGLPVEALIYTGGLERRPEGLSLLESAWRAGVPHQRVSDGVMGTLTATRPLPVVLAVVHARLEEAARLPLHAGSVLIVAEDLQNPDNLGMVVRTADAMGADAVVVSGADPLHRQCVRSARGAVGRIPIRVCDDVATWLLGLRGDGIRVWGATPKGAQIAYRSAMVAPLALAVGNEQHGLSAETLAACTDHVRIPMAPGQDSLNVGVAAGMLLYEAARQRIALRVEG